MGFGRTTITPVNTVMGRPIKDRVISEKQVDRLCQMWDNGEIQHSGTKTDLVKSCIGLNFGSEVPPYPYAGFNTLLWAKEGTVLKPVLPSFYIKHGQVPTPAHLLTTRSNTSVPQIVYCLAPAVEALNAVAQAQGAQMVQDTNAPSLTYFFVSEDEHEAI